MAITIDTAQLNDFLTIVKRAHGEFQAECGAKPRKYRRYFMTREALRNSISSIRNTIPAGTKVDPVPSGVAQAQWKKLIDELAASEKLLREEEKKVPRSVPTPAALSSGYVDTTNKTEQRSRRAEARRKLEKLLKEIYGERTGKLRFKVYEKMAKDAGQEGSPSTLWGFFNGDTVEQRQEILATRVAAAAAASGTAPAGGTAATDALAPTDGTQPGALAPPAPAGGLMMTLWPTDKPIYARPAAIGGVVVVVGIVGWMLLSTPKIKPAPKPAEKKTETRTP